MSNYVQKYLAIWFTFNVEILITILQYIACESDIEIKENNEYDM